MKNQTRNIVLNGEIFKWRVTHSHRPACVDQLLVFRANTSCAPFRIYFKAGDDAGLEYIPRNGILAIYTNNITINLNKPKTVEILTGRAIELGWSGDSPLTVHDGFAFVLALSEDSIYHISERQISGSH